MTADWNRKPQDRKLAAELEESYPYRKGGSRPEPTVKFDGTLLTKGKDYTLSYKNNGAVNDGSGQKKPTVIISGKGNFKGKISASYQISPADISCLTMKAADKSSKEKANIYKTKVEIFDEDGKKLAAGKDYDKTFTYTYEEDTELRDGTTRKAGDSVEKTDVIPHKTVLRVTAYAKSGGNYTKEISAVYRILSQNRDISKAKVTIPAQLYTGRKITPADQMKVVLGGQTLKEGEEYEIVGYENNINKGTATVTLRGIGECGGTKTVKFKIKGKGFLWWWRMVVEKLGYGIIHFSYTGADGS